MPGPIPFSERMDILSKDKQSNLILAIDPNYDTNDLFSYVLNTITKLGKYICAIKLNFHVILPLSFAELQRINLVAHRERLQVIADIKLNDIPNTNDVAIRYLHAMGFDSIIVNPFIGKDSLKSAVSSAHSLHCGIISLVYMSHGGATEGFGSSVSHQSLDGLTNTTSRFYRVFYENSKNCDVDGIIIGGNRLEVIRELSKNPNKIRIYSPGLVTQGGDIKSALECGSDYLIMGRAIINSTDPSMELQKIYKLVSQRFEKK